MSVRADIRVPDGTVAVTRGGVLRGSVFAREFLLEEGVDPLVCCMIVHDSTVSRCINMGKRYTSFRCFYGISRGFPRTYM